MLPSKKAVSYEPCLIDDPDDFYIVNRLKDDEEVKNYLNNCLSRYDYWANTKGWPYCRGAKRMAWRSEVLKSILIERGLEVPTLYDTVFGYEPPVKKRLTKGGLQEDVRLAEQQLKEAKARAASSHSSPLGTETEDQTYLDATEVEEEEETKEGLKGFLGLV